MTTPSIARALTVLLVVACAPRTGHADAAKARAANTRGYALHKQKNYRAAAAEYRTAIAEDPAYVLAHYNLACAASQLQDADTAVAELAWVFDRATWDPAAKSAIGKAIKDRDLAWLFDHDDDARRYANPANIEVVDVVTPPCCFIRGKASSDPAVARALAAASGRHDAACSAAAVLRRCCDRMRDTRDSSQPRSIRHCFAGVGHACDCDKGVTFDATRRALRLSPQVAGMRRQNLVRKLNKRPPRQCRTTRTSQHEVLREHRNPPAQEPSP